MAGVVLVEGPSDRVALEVLAARLGRDLAAEGVRVLDMGGATQVRRHVDRHVDRHGGGLVLAGLCDVGEERFFHRALEHAGLDGAGVFVCHADLEDELIRALGADAVVAVVEAQGESRSWRRFGKQPAQREHSVEHRLHRFMGTRSGRKAQYAEALVRALDLDAVPAPLAGVLDYVGTAAG